MLKIRNLTHTYPNGTRALVDVNLDIQAGMFGLLGPNGAGKSSLMRCVATLQIPSSGSIQFDDLDVLAQPERLRSLLGYLPQDFGVYPRVSAEDLLDHLAVLKGVTSRGERRDAVHTLLRQVNLWDLRKKAVASYSGGMRQRFGIAQALVGNPKLIIVDEPTAGLDPEERHRFNNLLSEIVRRWWSSYRLTLSMMLRIFARVQPFLWEGGSLSWEHLVSLLASCKGAYGRRGLTRKSWTRQVVSIR